MEKSEPLIFHFAPVLVPFLVQKPQRKVVTKKNISGNLKTSYCYDFMQKKSENCHACQFFITLSAFWPKKPRRRFCSKNPALATELAKTRKILWALSEKNSGQTDKLKNGQMNKGNFKRPSFCGSKKINREVIFK